jgi:hypothetical protein
LEALLETGHGPKTDTAPEKPAQENVKEEVERESVLANHGMSLVGTGIFEIAPTRIVSCHGVKRTDCKHSVGRLSRRKTAADM